ncbi:tetratricopeptide repeat protein [Azoarcus indigens]|nr:hypothetical protein [Azoarcus indigens]
MAMEHFRKLLLVVAFAVATLTPHLLRAQEMELSDAVYERITQLSKEGDDLADNGRFREAVERYLQALELVPDPKTDWEASTWLLAAIGDANFNSKNYEHASAALNDAMHCPGAIGNPFIHLRLGQSQFELGNIDRANDELARAYMGAGKEIFANEDPKYFAHLKTVLRPPANGEW